MTATVLRSVGSNFRSIAEPSFCRAARGGKPAPPKTIICSYVTKPGNQALRSLNKNEDLPPRWKRPWFLAMKRKRELEGSDPPLPRSSLRNWNHKAELSAFKLRLDINCDDNLLLAAFTEPLPSSGEDAADHRGLSERGRRFLETFISHYASVAFPRLPAAGQQAVADFLLNKANVSSVARMLGFQDLMRCVDFPPSDDVIYDCFAAVVEVVGMSEGPVACGRFVLDFLVPRLAEVDILEEVWPLVDPMGMLVAEEPGLEARLVRRSGVNTSTPVFFVALYSDGKFLSESGGESVPLAEADAALSALKRRYGVEAPSIVAPMGHRVDDAFLAKLFAPLMAEPFEHLPQSGSGG